MFYNKKNTSILIYYFI